MDNFFLPFIAQVIFISQGIMFILLFAGYWLAEEKKTIDHRTLMRYLFWVQTALNIIMVYLFITIPLDINYIPHILIATPLYLLIVYTYLVMEKKLPELLMIPREHQTLLMKITGIAWALAILSGIISFSFLAMGL